MTQSGNDLRTKVANLREHVQNNTIMQRQMRADPVGFLNAHGFSMEEQNDLLNEGTETKHLAIAADCHTTCTQTSCAWFSIGG